ncbi:MAG: CRISPR-associated helicase Cas3' [Oscillospiraceae bacterium]|nr:CRISPR-associated helicase Cas3' [Oscillospiraceae bacterium]
MDFIAHIRQIDHEEQTVSEHCRQTAKLAAQYGQHIGLSSSAELADWLHDIGKLTADFNDYIHGGTEIHRGELDHSFAGAKYLYEIASKSEDKTRKQAANLISRVILSHHGLNDWINVDALNTFQKRIAKEKYYSEIQQNLVESAFLPDVEMLLSKAGSEIAAISQKLKTMAKCAETYAFYLGMLERLLQSILVDADRTDTADFMSASKTEAFFDTEQLWQEMQQRMEQKLDSFSEKTDVISMQRKSISERCAAFAAHDVHICKLIVPTGGGKTLASLRFAIEYARRKKMQRIIYVAPFMSILEQNSDVIGEIAGQSAFLEHHSNILAEISGEDDRLHEYELRTEKWDSPVIATTMVQFLNALFSGKNGAVRRMHRLSNAVIIIDEVQSIPLKCVYLFNLAMNFLSQICGSTIVLCSATQPMFDLLEDYSILLDQNSSMSGDTSEDFEVFRRAKIIYQKKKGGYSYDEAADFCYDRFTENGSLLVVVNTKASAKELYQRLKDTEGALILHLSTNMCPQHRRDIIAQMRTALAEKQPVICVTTQLIEAGVDISFGCVVRALAGMDNAAQAAGRCNRNGEYHRECPVYILKLFEEKLGSLAEIKEAQSISAQMLDQTEETDFLSVPLMSDYFRKLYHNAQQRNQRNLLRYPLPQTTDQDLINLLSLNQHRNKEKGMKYSGQAFKTAGKLFEVIDSNTTDVLVPYNKDAERLIAELGSAHNPKEMMKLLRKAQKYTVSIYSATEHALQRESAIRTLYCGQDQQCGVQILDQRFYDADYGITTEGGAHEVLLL